MPHDSIACCSQNGGSWSSTVTAFFILAASCKTQSTRVRLGVRVMRVLFEQGIRYTMSEITTHNPIIWRRCILFDWQCFPSCSKPVVRRKHAHTNLIPRTQAQQTPGQSSGRTAVHVRYRQQSAGSAQFLPWANHARSCCTANRHSNWGLLRSCPAQSYHGPAADPAWSTIVAPHRHRRTRAHVGQHAAQYRSQAMLQGLNGQRATDSG